MKRLIVSVLAVAALAAGGAAFADAESQAGSAWRNDGVDYGPVPGTAEYYGNSGFPPAGQIVVPANGHNRYYADPRRAGPAYPYTRHPQRVTRNDRDGDGVANRYDRYPYDPSRW